MRFWIIATHKASGQRYRLDKTSMGNYLLVAPPCIAMKLPLFVVKNIFDALFKGDILPVKGSTYVSRDQYEWTMEEAW